MFVAAGLILLTEPDSARSHVADATHADKTGGPRYTDNHRTHWICPANTHCTKLNELNETVSVNGWATDHKECPGATDGTCRHRDSPEGWSKNWDYRGHSDEWSYTWRCDAGYKEPANTDRWGSTYKGGSHETSHGINARSEPSKSDTVNPPVFSWPHCQPKPTLTVTNEEVEEGQNAVFRVRLNGRTGKVDFSTYPGTATAGDDYDPTPVPESFRFSSPGESTRVSVEVKEDIFKEKSEVFYLRATGPAGLKDVGKATIGADLPLGTAEPGGWFNTAACDAGISVLKGTSVRGVSMPVYWPPTEDNYDMKHLWWRAVPSTTSNRPSRKGLPVGLGLRSEPASGSDNIADLFLEEPL